MRSTGCEHAAAPPMVLHSPQFGECGLAVLGECRAVGRVGEGTWFWFRGFVTAALAPRAPVADVGCRPGFGRGRRFFFRCRCSRLCRYRHIYRPRHCPRPGSFSPIAHVLHSLPQAVSSLLGLSSISHLSHDPFSRPASRWFRPRAVACSYAKGVKCCCFLFMASPMIFFFAAVPRSVVCPRFRASEHSGNAVPPTGIPFSEVPASQGA